MKKYIFLLCALLIAILAPAQEKVAAKGKITIEGRVFDRLTSHHLLDTEIEVLSAADSTVLATAKGGRRFWTSRQSGSSTSFVPDSSSTFEVEIPRAEGSYIFRIAKKGYETAYADYQLFGLKKRELTRTLPNIYLSRERREELSEVTVRATQIKFYNKGDTVVYNADAFQLPEGSTLDALVEQMPGVEIRDGGRIYVNGRYVESLLLNGKDFFKGNNKVMLQNIGAYAVKDVAVYEKTDEMDAVLGKRGDTEREYVMDVRLKKDYMAGNMLNAEAGIGTDSRYIGRIFAMHYTNNSRVAVYGNANNVNTDEQLDDSDSFSFSEEKPGINKKYSGGIDYRADNPQKTMEVSGNVDFTRYDSETHTTVDRLNFLQGGNSYDFSQTASRMRNMTISTAHDLRLKHDSWNMTVKPSFSYRNNDDNTGSTAATFAEEVAGVNTAVVDALFSGSYEELRSALVNRDRQMRRSRGHGWRGALYADSRIKIPGSSDAIALKFETSYDRSSSRSINSRGIDYSAGPDESYRQLQLTSARPRYDFMLRGLGRYYFNVPVGSLHLSYEYRHDQKRRNSDLLQMEARSITGEAEFAPGAELLPDPGNSYTSKLYTNTHLLKPIWNYEYKNERGSLQIRLEPNVGLESRRLFYRRGDVSAAPSRNSLLLRSDNSFISWTSADEVNTVQLYYDMNTESVNLVDLVDVCDSSDPLNIQLGNPDLKDAMNHRVIFSYSHYKNGGVNHWLRYDFTTVDNSIVRGYRYDSATGTRTYRSYNVNGTNNMSMFYTLHFQFGPDKAFSLYSSTSGELYNYVQMIGNDAEPTPQKVRTYTLAENAGINYRHKIFYVNLAGYVVWNSTHSRFNAYSKLDSWRYSGVLSGRVQLPLDFSIETDIRATRRFGMLEASMNRTDVLWNAQLNCSLQDGRWLLSLCGYDMLDQMRGIDYVVDALGRTQTLNLTLGRYAMLKVQYRFDFKPRRAR